MEGSSLFLLEQWRAFLGSDDMQFSSLGLHITNKCNMCCPHCITDASCSGSDIMSIEDIEFWVKSAKGYFENICITGGEVLLFPDLVEQTLKCINSNGFTSSLVSNCFWVHNSSSYNHILQMLNACSLTKLAVSFDEFHDNRMFNIIDLEKLLSEDKRTFSIVVQPCYMSESDLQKKKKDLEILCQRYNCSFDPSVIVPFGRARKIVPKSKNISKMSMPCDVVRLPMIRYDGVFMACCGPAVDSPNFSPLVHYNADSTVFDVVKNDLIINLLYLRGPYYLYDNLTDNLKLKISNNEHIGSVCGLCRAMLDCKEIVDYLYGLFEKEKWIILCSSELTNKNGCAL